MTFALMLAFALLRLTGFIVEPRLSEEAIHAVTGEPSRVRWPLADDRPLRIVTWNIERGVAFDAIASVLEELDADIMLLQEVDRFCARSAYRDVAKDLAVALRMNFVTGGEFQEIGEGRRGVACVSGQAVLSRAPIDAAAVLKFDDQASLKWQINPAQPRRGGRVALRAAAAGVTVYSVHLESGANEPRRVNQVREIVANADHLGGPVIVGGDFNNTGDERSQMFFEMSLGRFVNTMLGGSVSQEERRRPIDWVFTRGIRGKAGVVRAPQASDHDPIVVAVESVQRRF
jgi:endonuclease/exonuclease/phosphatase family metal-dependent hydrolase